jgi:hypothetical protein
MMRYFLLGLKVLDISRAGKICSPLTTECARCGTRVISIGITLPRAAPIDHRGNDSIWAANEKMGKNNMWNENIGEEITWTHNIGQQTKGRWNLWKANIKEGWDHVSTKTKSSPLTHH